MSRSFSGNSTSAHDRNSVSQNFVPFGKKIMFEDVMIVITFAKANNKEGNTESDPQELE